MIIILGIIHGNSKTAILTYDSGKVTSVFHGRSFISHTECVCHICHETYYVFFDLHKPYKRCDSNNSINSYIGIWSPLKISRRIPPSLYFLSTQWYKYLHMYVYITVCLHDICYVFFYVVYRIFCTLLNIMTYGYANSRCS